MIEFFINENNITHLVINYVINYNHQWYPGCYINTYEKLVGDTLKIINKSSTKVIFFGALDNIMADGYTHIYFFIYPSTYLKIEDYFQYWYHTFTTQGGYFDKETYKINPIVWDVIDECLDIFYKNDVIYHGYENLIKKSPQFKIQYKYPLQYQFKISKILQVPGDNHNDIINILENFQNHQTKIDSIISEDNTIIIKYHHHIHYEIEENLTIKYHYNTIHQTVNLNLSKPLIMGCNGQIHSSIDGPHINQIIDQYHKYMNFDTIITLKFYGLKDFFIGQRIQYEEYKGIIISITLEHFYNNTITTIGIKSYKQWVNYNILPIYPKEYIIDESFIMDQWHKNWNIIMDEKIQCTLPHIQVIYQSIDHKDIIIKPQ
jgi:hypothetical protein